MPQSIERTAFIQTLDIVGGISARVDRTNGGSDAMDLVIHADSTWLVIRGPP
jgi:hypothetical protein